MASESPVDELLAALPEVGLRLWMLDQCADKWHAAIYDPKNPLASRTEGEASTAAGALIAALQLAGINVEDSP